MKYRHWDENKILGQGISILTDTANSRIIGEGDVLKVGLHKAEEYAISLVLYSRAYARVSAVGWDGRGLLLT